MVICLFSLYWPTFWALVLFVGGADIVLMICLFAYILTNKAKGYIGLIDLLLLIATTVCYAIPLGQTIRYLRPADDRITDPELLRILIPTIACLWLLIYMLRLLFTKK